jgi:hypothetical protein
MAVTVTVEDGSGVAGSVEVEYATTAAAGTMFSVIDGLLAGLLAVEATTSGYTARAVRA